MTTQATGSFEFKRWDEQPYSEGDGGVKLTRASVTNAFHGDVEGEGRLEYLLAHSADGSGSFIGFEHVIGRVGQRSGSFVLQHTGTFDGETIQASWFVVPGFGTGDLCQLRGEGGFVARHGQQATPFTLDYQIESAAQPQVQAQAQPDEEMASPVGQDRN